MSIHRGWSLPWRGGGERLGAIGRLVTCLGASTVLACAGASPPGGDTAPARPPAPALLLPPAGAMLDNGCTAIANARQWSFDWDDAPGADRYHLQVTGPAAAPGIDRDDLTASAFSVDATQHVPDDQRTGWSWRVRAGAGGVWGDFGPSRAFEVEPVDNDCACPALLSPAAGAVVDNGCTSRSDPIAWSFDWTDCAGSDLYELVVAKVGSTAAAIHELLAASDFSQDQVGFVLDANRLDWSWRVRARTNGTWGEWTPERPFDLEPVDSDCP